eukprot:GHVL01014551.1.p1 GENE.GHVL01014551.1~~GHVL01014551.1.p1  ORF type:complete len:964 (-),score=138.17 GHVL01014551.1:1298-4189(-)
MQNPEFAGRLDFRGKLSGENNFDLIDPQVSWHQVSVPQVFKPDFGSIWSNILAKLNVRFAFAVVQFSHCFNPKSQEKKRLEDVPNLKPENRTITLGVSCVKEPCVHKTVTNLNKLQSIGGGFWASFQEPGVVSSIWCVVLVMNDADYVSIFPHQAFPKHDPTVLHWCDKTYENLKAALTRLQDESDKKAFAVVDDDEVSYFASDGSPQQLARERSNSDNIPFNLPRKMKRSTKKNGFSSNAPKDAPVVPLPTWTEAEVSSDTPCDDETPCKNGGKHRNSFNISERGGSRLMSQALRGISSAAVTSSTSDEVDDSGEFKWCDKRTSSSTEVPYDSRHISQSITPPRKLADTSVDDSSDFIRNKPPSHHRKFERPHASASDAVVVERSGFGGSSARQSNKGALLSNSISSNSLVSMDARYRCTDNFSGRPPVDRTSKRYNNEGFCNKKAPTQRIFYGNSSRPSYSNNSSMSYSCELDHGCRRNKGPSKDNVDSEGSSRALVRDTVVYNQHGGYNCYNLSRLSSRTSSAANSLVPQRHKSAGTRPSSTTNGISMPCLLPSPPPFSQPSPSTTFPQFCSSNDEQRKMMDASRRVSKNYAAALNRQSSDLASTTHSSSSRLPQYNNFLKPNSQKPPNYRRPSVTGDGGTNSSHNSVNTAVEDSSDGKSVRRAPSIDSRNTSVSQTGENKTRSCRGVWKRLAVQRTKFSEAFLRHEGMDTNMNMANFNVTKFVEMTTPSALVKPGQVPLIVDTDHVEYDYHLSDLWKSLEDVSACGVSVPLFDSDGLLSRTVFVPHISALTMWSKSKDETCSSRAVIRMVDDRPPYLRKSLYLAVNDLCPNRDHDKSLNLFSANASDIDLDKSWLAVLWVPLQSEIGPGTSPIFLCYYNFKCCAKTNNDGLATLQQLAVIPNRNDVVNWHRENTQTSNYDSSKRFWDGQFSSIERYMKHWDCRTHPDLEFCKSRYNSPF